jgi:O-antigen ligase
VLGSLRYRIAVAGLLVLAVALFGGASRIDEPAQLPIRLAAIAALGASVWPLDFARLRAHRGLVLFAVACCGLPLMQLIPLPPVVWDRLPGHAAYAEIAHATGTVGWRPLSLTPELTANALFALLVPTAAALAMLYLDRNERKLAVAAFVIVALASALLGLTQLAVADDRLRLYLNTSENAPVGLFANRNHQAALLACAFPLGAAVIPAGGAARARLVACGFLAPAGLVAGAVLLLTGSRMGVLLGIGGIAGAAWTLRARGLLALPARRTAAVATVLGAGAIIGLVGAALAFDGELMQRLRYQDVAADSRWATLPALLRTARAFFPTGAGLGSFASVYPQFEPNALLSTIYLNQAHNEPLQLVIEGGAPALILLLVFGWWWVRTATRIVRHRSSAPQRGLPRAAVVITALLMLSSLVDYPLRTPLLAALFAFGCVEMALGIRGRGAPG